MEWDSVLLWLVGMSCGLTAFTATRARPMLRGYLVVSLLIGAITAAMYFLLPAHAGEIGGVLWGLFLVAPSLLQRRAARYANRQRFDHAWRWMTVTSFLHPADGVPQTARLLRALHQAESKGTTDAVIAELDALVLKSPTRINRSARLQRARLTRDWAGSLDWVAAHVPPAQLRKDAGLLPLTVRGFGETGQLPEMLLAATSADLPTHPVFAPTRAMVRMVALAFAGQSADVERLLIGPLMDLPAAVKQSWLGTAELAAGDTQAGRDRLTAAAGDPSTTAGTRAAILHRLTSPPVIASTVLTPPDVAFVQRLLHDIDHEHRYLPTARSMGRPWVTIGLIVANVAMFFVEMQQGSATDDATLYKLGAMVPQAMQQHEYYRFFMANFLHFGTAHLVMNMLGLWVLGPFVEFSLGRVKYLLVYLLTGVATMASVGALMVYRGDPNDILIGASGAIMALIGATAAVLLRGWWAGRAKVAGRRLRTIGLILVMQVVFDHFTPQVSGSAHLIGAGWGFVLASVLPHRKRRGV